MGIGERLLVGVFGLVLWLLSTLGSLDIGEIALEVVQVSEVGWAEDGADGTSNGEGDVWPDEIGVLDGSRTGERDGSRDGGWEQGKGVNEGLHPSGSSGVGDLVRGDDGEELSNGRD